MSNPNKITLSLHKSPDSARFLWVDYKHELVSAKCPIITLDANAGAFTSDYFPPIALMIKQNVQGKTRFGRISTGLEA